MDPTFFELLASDHFPIFIQPVFELFLSRAFPRGTTVYKWRAEIFVFLRLCIDNYHLRHYSSPFSTKHFGLQLNSPNYPFPLTRFQRHMILFITTGLPYIAARIKNYSLSLTHFLDENGEPLQGDDVDIPTSLSSEPQPFISFQDCWELLYPNDIRKRLQRGKFVRKDLEKLEKIGKLGKKFGQFDKKIQTNEHERDEKDEKKERLEKPTPFVTSRSQNSPISKTIHPINQTLHTATQSPILSQNSNSMSYTPQMVPQMPQTHTQPIIQPFASPQTQPQPDPKQFSTPQRQSKHLVYSSPTIRESPNVNVIGGTIFEALGTSQSGGSDTSQHNLSLTNSSLNYSVNSLYKNHCNANGGNVIGTRFQGEIDRDCYGLDFGETSESNFEGNIDGNINEGNEADQCDQNRKFQSKFHGTHSKRNQKNNRFNQNQNPTPNSKLNTDNTTTRAIHETGKLHPDVRTPTGVLKTEKQLSRPKNYHAAHLTHPALQPPLGLDSTVPLGTVLTSKLGNQRDEYLSFHLKRFFFSGLDTATILLTNILTPTQLEPALSDSLSRFFTAIRNLLTHSQKVNVTLLAFFRVNFETFRYYARYYALLLFPWTYTAISSISFVNKLGFLLGYTPCWNWFITALTGGVTYSRLDPSPPSFKALRSLMETPQYTPLPRERGNFFGLFESPNRARADPFDEDFNPFGGGSQTTRRLGGGRDGFGVERPKFSFFPTIQQGLYDKHGSRYAKYSFPTRIILTLMNLIGKVVKSIRFNTKMAYNFLCGNVKAIVVLILIGKQFLDVLSDRSDQQQRSLFEEITSNTTANNISGRNAANIPVDPANVDTNRLEGESMGVIASFIFGQQGSNQAIPRLNQGNSNTLFNSDNAGRYGPFAPPKAIFEIGKQPELMVAKVNPDADDHLQIDVSKKTQRRKFRRGMREEGKKWGINVIGGATKKSWRGKGKVGEGKVEDGKVEDGKVEEGKVTNVGTIVVGSSGGSGSVLLKPIPIGSTNRGSFRTQNTPLHPLDDSADFMGRNAKIEKIETNTILAKQNPAHFAPIPSDLNTCQWCLTSPLNAIGATNAGYCACYQCLFEFVEKYGKCPFSHTPMTPDDIRSIWVK
jgi:hypothetical protein